jgi:hypothetical protein
MRAADLQSPAAEFAPFQVVGHSDLEGELLGVGDRKDRLGRSGVFVPYLLMGTRRGRRRLDASMHPGDALHEPLPLIHPKSAGFGGNGFRERGRAWVGREPRSASPEPYVFLVNLYDSQGQAENLLPRDEYGLPLYSYERRSARAAMRPSRGSRRLT